MALEWGLVVRKKKLKDSQPSLMNSGKLTTQSLSEIQNLVGQKRTENCCPLCGTEIYPKLITRVFGQQGQDYEPLEGEPVVLIHCVDCLSMSLRHFNKHLDANLLP